MQKLAKSNIISSAKGRSGGFYLNDEQLQTLTIKDVCSAFDGEKILSDCILGLNECNENNPCPVHHIGVKIKVKIDYILSLKICDIKDVGNIKFNL